MSKAGSPRWRYIAMRLEGTPIARKALQNAIIGRARHEQVPEPHLTRFEWPHAIVRATHATAEATRAMLGRLTFAVENDAKVELKAVTLGTSGTLKALTGRHRILMQRAPNDASDRTSGKAARPRTPPRLQRRDRNPLTRSRQ
jgi:RNase P/RNase MRP subunit POP5